MDFLNALNISGSALTAQKLRMDIMSQNIANSDVTRTQTGGPYRRQMTLFQSIDEGVFRNALQKASKSGGVAPAQALKALARGRDMTVNSGGVKVAAIIQDQSDFVPVYDPTHPDANEEGYVLMPNVNRTQEMIDMLGATRAYSANVTMFNATKSMISTALQIGR
ncbi:MAG: flagellar basal body rod protein FlgC [Clostridiales Family XIII bacterium]|jgi:flagellar basal-body rod protein FlgC|nr:flagellar basal body rod protein FlgC [Clostridiales Family XIII bacterium]